MRILISGVAGFIGSHLADHLVAQGHHVIGVDNLCTGSRANIAHLDRQPRFSFLERDVLEPLPIDGPLDQVYHLASPASPAAYGKRRIDTLKANSQGAWNLLDLAVDKSARMLFASSSGIYGDVQVAPQKEEHWGNVNPVGLRSVYEEAKRFGEAITMAYHRERGADTRIVRIFHAYGPRMALADGRAVTNFVLQALSNEPLTVYGDGTQTRSICCVADIVRGMTLAMEGDFHEPVNLGSADEVSVVQLAKEIIDLVPGTASRIAFQPALAYDPRVRRPDISRARLILGWSPQVSRREGLAQVVEYYRNNPSR